MSRTSGPVVGVFAGFAIASLWLAQPAVAQVQASPASVDMSAQFSRGEYMQVAGRAEAASGADNMALAARALLAHCMTGAEEPDVSVVDRAARDAEAALKIDPDHEEGRLQLAIALSLKSRTMGALDVWSAGYGDRGKKLAREVLKSDPGNFYAHGFLAVWNIEVVRRGGSLGAKLMGASLADAREHYAAAVGLAPNEIGVHWQYARALAALDARKYGDEAAVALARALAAQPEDHVAQVMQARAAELATALSGDRKAAQRLARELL
jgi:tetratricopeptide (TPR) repeat protein